MLSPLMRRVVMCALLLWLAPAANASASPLLATYWGQFAGGPLAGTTFSVNYVFDPIPPAGPNAFPCCADGQWPISWLRLNVGGHQVMAQSNPGLTFMTNSAVGILGPFWNVPTAMLPAGLLSWGFSGDPLYVYTFADPAGGPGVVIDGFTNVSITPLAHSVPEPSTLALLGAGAAVALARRARHGVSRHKPRA